MKLTQLTMCKNHRENKHFFPEKHSLLVSFLAFLLSLTMYPCQNTRLVHTSNHKKRKEKKEKKEKQIQLHIVFFCIFF